MSGLILPSTYHFTQAIDRGQDVNDITRSVQDGDPTVGWRGDATMDVFREGSVVYVAGFDAAGERYIAARAHMADADWRKTLLVKLREGDWQNEQTMVEKIKAEQEKRQADKDAVRQDQIAEIADKFTTALFKSNSMRRHF